MKHIKTQQELNEAQENLNISDVSDSLNEKYEQKIYQLLSSVSQEKGVINYLTKAIGSKFSDEEMRAFDKFINSIKK
jgi:uncharacterized protein YbgA (DUF1722 family)